MAVSRPAYICLENVKLFSDNIMILIRGLCPIDPSARRENSVDGITGTIHVHSNRIRSFVKLEKRKHDFLLIKQKYMK